MEIWKDVSFAWDWEYVACKLLDIEDYVPNFQGPLMCERPYRFRLLGVLHNSADDRLPATVLEWQKGLIAHASQGCSRILCEENLEYFVESWKAKSLRDGKVYVDHARANLGPEERYRSRPYLMLRGSGLINHEASLKPGLPLAAGADRGSVKVIDHLRRDWLRRSEQDPIYIAYERAATYLLACVWPLESPEFEPQRAWVLRSIHQARKAREKGDPGGWNLVYVGAGHEPEVLRHLCCPVTPRLIPLSLYNIVPYRAEGRAYLRQLLRSYLNL